MIVPDHMYVSNVGLRKGYPIWGYIKAGYKGVYFSVLRMERSRVWKINGWTGAENDRAFR
jgi:hypothetical protein